LAHDISIHDVRKVEILIAEDSPTQAEKLRYLLEENFYTATTAANGKEALAAARQRKPTLIISDVMMPEMDGFTLCGEIKKDPELKDIPVILLTSLSDIEDIMKGLESGADNFLRKPYDDQYLLNRIDDLLMSHELRKSQNTQMGMDTYLGGQKRFITSERQQIVDLLISVYEDAIRINAELTARQLELTHSNRLLTGLYRIAEGLNQAATEREVCENSLEYVMNLPGVKAGWIYLWNEGNLRLAAARNLPASFATNSTEALCECQRLLVAGEVDRAREILKCERIASSEATPSYPSCHASIPLWSGSQCQGIMNLLGFEQDPFKDNEFDTFYGVGHQVGVALERARLHQHMEKLVEERTAALTAEIVQRKEYEARVIRLNRIYSVLSGINAAIVRVRGVQELFDKACRILAVQGEFAFAWIGLFEANTEKITPMAQAERDSGYLSQLDQSAVIDASRGSSLMGNVATDLKPAICNNLIGERMQGLNPLVLPPSYRSMAILPLILEGQLAGILTLYAPETGFFDDDEMALLTEMAGNISFAMDHLKKEERINYLAFFDAVTDLPNRALFLDRVDQRIQMIRPDHEMLSVIVLDIERFSSINESLGHGAGDALLRELAKRLKQLLSEADILAHLSADYFAIARKHEEESTDIAHILEKLLFGVQNRPFLIAGQELWVSARAGASFFPNDGLDTDTLLRNAETTLKKAKHSSDKHLFYAPEFHARVKEKLKLEIKLRQALEQEQFVLHYQPKVHLDSGQISGLEALMRWQDPENGLVFPLGFIPLLEETRMILEAGRWAMTKAISDAKKWKAIALNPPKISVNVSAIQLQQKDFVDMVASVVDGAGDLVAPLQFEITESVIMHDIKANIEKLNLIRDMNIEVAIDDFGTGYSSLSYIAKLPVNVLKIDRAFITHMNTNPDDLSIVSAMISLAHTLKLRVVAEGVETVEHADLLRKLKCDEMQGYLFSPGVTAAKIIEFLYEKKSLQAGVTH
jgi:diguanylate cyclase (GGDEF)-like protein